MKGGIHRLVAAFMLGVAVCSQAQQAPMDSRPQTVVDAARQKSTEKKAKRVYTNDDFRSPVDESGTAAAVQDVGGQESGRSGTENAGSGSENAAQNTIDVNQAKKIVEAKQIQIDTMTEEKTRLEQRLHEPNRSNDESAAISESIRSIEQSIDRWKKERDGAQKVIDESKPKPEPGQ
jgi:hypothetical protein